MKIDWGSLIVDIVKKKDLDCGDFKDCWEDDYDWTELDKFVTYNYEELLLGYGEVEADRIKENMTREELRKDLEEYCKENLK